MGEKAFQGNYVQCSEITEFFFCALHCLPTYLLIVFYLCFISVLPLGGICTM